MSAFAGAAPPKPFDPARAERTFETLAAEGAAPEGMMRAVLAGAFGNSPFLARLALRERAVLVPLFAEGPRMVVAQANDLALSAADAETVADAMARQRNAKRQAALAIALADIAGIWTLDEVTRALTEFADACVKGALRFVLRCAAARAEMT